MCPFLFAENYISRELLSLLKRVNGNKFERTDNMNNGRANCTIQQLYIMSQIFEHSMDYIISGKKGRQENEITFAQREAIDKMLRAFDK